MPKKYSLHKSVLSLVANNPGIGIDRLLYLLEKEYGFIKDIRNIRVLLYNLKKTNELVIDNSMPCEVCRRTIRPIKLGSLHTKRRD